MGLIFWDEIAVILSRAGNIKWSNQVQVAGRSEKREFASQLWELQVIYPA